VFHAQRGGNLRPLGQRGCQSHAEIATTLDRPEPTVRQIAHRAREHVQARRPRFDTDQSQREMVTAQFIAACGGGDLNAVMELLAPEVTA
jgi:RNA polymerase sigma-70 factor (ECF subfamily)